MRAWKMAGALANPNGITRYSKWPRGVLNAVFHSSPSRIRTEVVGIAQVQLSENRGGLEGLKKSINQGQRVFIVDGDVIKEVQIENW